MTLLKQMANNWLSKQKEYPNMPGLLADPIFLIVDVQSEKMVVTLLKKVLSVQVHT